MTEAEENEIADRRLAERRDKLNEAMALTLTTDDVRELKKIANYSRLGKVITAFLMGIGALGYGAAQLYLQIKGH